MTTWVGHTTRASRGQRSAPCPTCGRLWSPSLAERVAIWLDAHPEECLTAADVEVKFAASRATVNHAMRAAVARGLVRREKAGHEAAEYASVKGLQEPSADAAVADCGGREPVRV